MHKVKLDDDLVKIALARRGRLRLFESIDPKRTAHLIIDVQTGFMTPGAPAEIAPAAAIIPNVNTISAACREIEPEDMRINKFRFGTFVDGSSDLHQRLRARGIDTVIITGCATNICCESTARDAMMLNYKVLFVSDATATHTDFEHNNTLNNMMLTFADVVSTADVTLLLKA